MGAGEGRIGVARLPQEQRLQDVAGAAVSLEHGAVQQVLSVVSLVVQCHCNIYFQHFKYLQHGGRGESFEYCSFLISKLLERTYLASRTPGSHGVHVGGVLSLGSGIYSDKRLGLGLFAITNIKSTSTAFLTFLSAKQTCRS